MLATSAHDGPFRGLGPADANSTVLHKTGSPERARDDDGIREPSASAKAPA